MRMRIAVLTVSVFGVVFAATTSEAQQRKGIQRFREEVQVTAAPGALSLGSTDHILTFSRPVALPGISLAPGAYRFRLREDRSLLVMAANLSQNYLWIHTQPVSRAVTTDTHDVWFGAPLAEGAPRSITAWFLPGETVGYELFYPKMRAERMVSNEAIVELTDPRLSFTDLGLLTGARAITVVRTKETPARVQLSVRYSYYVSKCEERSSDVDDSMGCAWYVRTHDVASGGSRLTLDFSKARPLTGDMSEILKLYLSTLEDERLHTRSEISSEAGRYRVKGDGRRISFIAMPR